MPKLIRPKVYPTQGKTAVGYVSGVMTAGVQD